MDNRLKEITEQVEKDIRPIFEKIQINCEKNSKKVLEAFWKYIAIYLKQKML